MRSQWESETKKKNEDKKESRNLPPIFQNIAVIHGVEYPIGFIFYFF